MRQFEYKIVPVDVEEVRKGVLNEAGLEGWALVTVGPMLDSEYNEHSYAFFIRPLEGEEFESVEHMKTGMTISDFLRRAHGDQGEVETDETHFPGRPW